MKISTNRQELKSLNACARGFKTFVEAHGDNDATLSQCLESNGWYDVWWLISETYNQFSDEQKHDLRVLACSYAKINIEKIKPYCSEGDYKIITSYLESPTESAASSAWSAASSAWSAAESARSAWSAAESAARSAAESAWSAASSAWSAASSAWSAARSAWSAAESARSARSAAESARSAARSAAESAARSAAESARSAWSAAMKENEDKFKGLLLKWENQQ